MALRDDEYALLKGKKHPLYKGVLREAHDNGLLALECRVLQYPSEENHWTAVCQATAIFPGPEGRERVFTEIGDADDSNVNPMIRPHKIRMAATRAKGRALRDALGIGEALKEEIDGTEESDLGTMRPETPSRRVEVSQAPARAGARAQPAPVRQAEPVVEPASPAYCDWPNCGLELTADEVKGCRLPKYREFFKGRLLCADHRREAKQQLAEQPSS